MFVTVSAAAPYASLKKREEAARHATRRGRPFIQASLRRKGHLSYPTGRKRNLLGICSKSGRRRRRNKRKENDEREKARTTTTTTTTTTNSSVSDRKKHRRWIERHERKKAAGEWLATERIRVFLQLRPQVVVVVSSLVVTDAHPGNPDQASQFKKIEQRLADIAAAAVTLLQQHRRRDGAGGRRRDFCRCCQ